jgi:hypothetical protein
MYFVFHSKQGVHLWENLRLCFPVSELSVDLTYCDVQTVGRLFTAVAMRRNN